MALPDGLATLTVTAGPYLTAGGGVASGRVRLVPESRAVHIPTGAVIVAGATIDLDPDTGVGSDVVAASDAAGLTPNPLAYWAYWELNGVPSPQPQRVLLTGSGTVDVDTLLPVAASAGPVAVPAVTSLGGLTGPISTQQLTDLIGGAPTGGGVSVPDGASLVLATDDTTVADAHPEYTWLILDPATDTTPPAADTTPPAVPSGLTATAGDGQVTLDWADVTDPDFDHYEYRAGTTNPPAGTPTSVTASAVIVTGLTEGTGYYFQVRAVDATGNASAWSTAASATPTAPPATPTAPGAPTGVTATAGNGQASLTWTAPASNGGAAVTDYVIQYSADSGATWATFADGTSTATTATVTGLTNGTGYVFRVAAVNSAGTGSYSSASGAVTPTAPTGGGPALLQTAYGTATATTTATATLPAAPTAGNLLVLIAGLNNVPANINTPTGWTQATNNGSAGVSCAAKVFYRVAQAGDTAAQTVTATQNGSIDLVVAEFTGVAALDQIGGGTFTSASTERTDTTAATTAAAGVAVSAVRLSGASGGFVGWSDGYITLPTSAASDVFFASYKVLTAAASTGTSATWTTSRVGARTLATFK